MSSARWPATRCVHYDVAPKIGSTLSRQTFDGDVALYCDSAAAVCSPRARGFKSIGDFPDYQYFGGNSEMRGYDYLQFIGQNIAFANAELRFPIIEAALTPIGVVGGVRGVFFANIGGGWFDGQPSPTADGRRLPVLQRQRRALPDDRRLRAGRAPAIPDRSEPADSNLRRDQNGRRIPAAGRSRVIRHRASRPSRSGSRFTSTGPGGRSSTRNGRTSCSPSAGGSPSSASRASPSGSDTTSEWLRA